MLATVWFAIIASMLAIYVVLDGFDLGAGALHLGVARNEDERRTVLRSIGPVWDGNEVWLLAAGGALYCAFPALYAASFAGFYLPLMIVLWLLILRGISIEFRNHLDNPIWKPLWDTIFCGSSALLAVFYGAALGNVVRGVPLDANGEFFLALWTDWTPGPDPGIFDWYTVLTGLLAFATLAQHGALWLNLKSAGAMQARARRVALAAWWAVLLLTVVAAWASFSIQPALGQSFAARPWGCVFPALALAGLAGIQVMLRRNRETPAFLASALYIVGMLTAVVFGVYPNVLPATSAGFSLTVANAAAPDSGLRIALGWFVPGAALATGYFVFLYRKFAGKSHAGGYGH
jgi:cytochrome d ubiquinol oxidase subunit II